MGVKIPPKLLKLLTGSSFEPGTLSLVQTVDQIFVDNEMPFFPAYTDHGAHHVTAVLNAAERLIPARVWEGGLLLPTDAAVLIAASLLHDLALHIREKGFIALVSESSQYSPLPWFDQDQPRRRADQPWCDLWRDFCKEARRFTQSDLDRIFGPGQETPQIAFGDVDLESDGWVANDRLLIGEFLRRHHARLGHEIALTGFPGLDEKKFPLLESLLPGLADAVGTTARSHTESLRTMVAYLDYCQPGDQRPAGALLMYLMGVLRVADFFQLDATRVSPLLLHLKDPQSPQSVAEWSKHQAIQNISWDNKDPSAINIQISHAHSLRTHLQLGELFSLLQSELDTTTAVLSETYGGSDLGDLGLDRRRVTTNLFQKSLHARLGFVPERARLRSAEDLFRLVIADLYGNEPTVAGRELLQNATDAVREMEHWKAREAVEIDSAEFRDLPTDVLIELREFDRESSLLRVVDKGIGMTPQTIIDCFLTAGASFSPSLDDDELSDAATAFRWMKAGRFGVGVFASFLLGPEVCVSTRHASSKRGIRFSARLDDDLIQLDWLDDVPLGTEVIVPFANSYWTEGSPDAALRAKRSGQLPDLLENIKDYYRLDYPRVTYRYTSCDGHSIDHEGVVNIPSPMSPAALPAWRALTAPGFDAIYWSEKARSSGGFSYRRAQGAEVVHNGITLKKPGQQHAKRTYRWTNDIARQNVDTPDIAVFDTRQSIGVSLHRYELTSHQLPFEEELLQSIGADMLAHALVFGESDYPLGVRWAFQPLMGNTTWVPLLPTLVNRYVEDHFCVLWLADPQLVGPWQEPIGPEFLDTNGRHWSELPHRIVLPARYKESGWRNSHHATWGLLPDDVINSVMSLKATIDREPLIGIFANYDTSEIMPFTGGWRKQSAAWGHNKEPLQIWKKVFSNFDYSPALQGLGYALRVTTIELLRRAGAGSIALTVFGPSKTDSVSCDPLSAKWVSSLSGSLERDTEARTARRRTLVEADLELQTATERWDRCSDSG
jgi:hypothetical protein